MSSDFVDRWVRAKEIFKPGILPISRSTFYKLIQKGEFPVGQEISANVVAWKVSTVLRWADGRGMRVRRPSVLRSGAVGSLASEQRWQELHKEWKVSCCRSRGHLPKLTPPVLRTQLG